MRNDTFIANGEVPIGIREFNIAKCSGQRVQIQLNHLDHPSHHRFNPDAVVFFLNVENSNSGYSEKYWMSIEALQEYINQHNEI